jgi:diguanylate cyclase (GGDEF)-like protein
MVTPSGAWVGSLNGRRRRFSAHARTASLSMLLVAGSATLLTGIRLDVGPVSDTRVQWWLIALISIAAEFMVFNVEFRREVYTFTFSEIPLVLGLFLASPLQLIAGRLVGEALFLIVKERQPPRKLCLNLASFFGECVVLLGVFQLLEGQRSVDQPTMWVRALVAICLADLLSFVIVAYAVRWHGGELQLRSILAAGALTVPVNTSFALLAGLLLADEPWGLALLAGIALFLVVAYRSFSSLRQRFESLSQLYEFTRLVSGSQRPDVVLESILGKAKDLFRAERAEIWLSDGSGSVVGLAVNDDGRSSREMSAGAALDIRAWFARSRDALVIAANSDDGTTRSIALALRASDAIVAPITEAGEIVGIVAVIDRIGDSSFASREAPMFATLANHASVALENGRLIVRLHEHARQRDYDALHDALTALPNRVLFATRLDEALGRMSSDGGSLAVAVMDLDGFKEINDTLGHHAGDAVLVEIAQRLVRVVDPSVIVARLGGDEFGLLFTHPPTRAELVRSVQAIRQQLSLPSEIDGVRINVSASVGLAIAPGDGIDGATLLQRADVAMYDAKTGTGDGVAFYNPNADTNSPRRLTLVNGLNTAIANGELSVLYQPKINLARAEITGFESLVRWTHPVLGPISPVEFIPLAERSGMIHQLTEFVLQSALEQAGRWQAAGFDWGVAVNLSMRNLLDTELVATVARALQASGVAPNRLTLEITESNVMHDAVRTIATLEQLAALGLRLSIDDFGTGYSSLSYLQQLPVDEIKIDQCFVLAMTTDPGAAAIVRTVLDLARNLGLRPVAEGVEDRATSQRLRGLGCEEAQGYFFARPMHPDMVLAYPEHLAALLARPTTVDENWDLADVLL